MHSEDEDRVYNFISLRVERSSSPQGKRQVNAPTPGNPGSSEGTDLEAGFADGVSELQEQVGGLGLLQEDGPGSRGPGEACDVGAARNGAAAGLGTPRRPQTRRSWGRGMSAQAPGRGDPVGP